MFLQKLEIQNINLEIEFFFTKELVIKFVFGDQKKCFCYFSCTKNQAA